MTIRMLSRNQSEVTKAEWTHRVVLTKYLADDRFSVKRIKCCRYNGKPVVAGLFYHNAPLRDVIRKVRDPYSEIIRSGVWLLPVEELNGQLLDCTETTVLLDMNKNIFKIFIPGESKPLVRARRNDNTIFQSRFKETRCWDYLPLDRYQLRSSEPRPSGCHFDLVKKYISVGDDLYKTELVMGCYSKELYPTLKEAHYAYMTGGEGTWEIPIVPVEEKTLLQGHLYVSPDDFQAVWVTNENRLRLNE